MTGHCPPRPVAVHARLTLAAAAVFGVWQLGWLADQADRIDALLHTPWTVSGWLAAWAAVTLTSAVAAISGRDLPARIAFGVLLVVEGAGILVALSADRPNGEQFWSIGQAGLIVAVCAVMLSSPLRTLPDVPSER